MSITKLTPVWGAQGDAHAHDLSYVQPTKPPPRIIVGLLTGELVDHQAPVRPRCKRE